MGYLLRIAIFLILGWLAWRLVRRLMVSEKLPVKPSDQDKIEVIPCVVCGVHIPRNDALMHDNKAYCSATHLESDNK